MSKNCIFTIGLLYYDYRNNYYSSFAGNIFVSILIGNVDTKIIVSQLICFSSEVLIKINESILLEKSFKIESSF